MIGQEFAGYTITRKLATGGMTNLYVGVDAEQKRAVIRRLRSDYVKNRRVVKSFMHGAEVLSKLHHPNIVRLIKAGRYKGESFIITEYIEARNIKDLIFAKSPLLYENLVTMFRQIAAAVNHVHVAGFWHLDVKPENFIVRDDGLVILVDFDLAIKRKPRPVKLSPLPGTFAYMPPESLKRGLVDDQTDIFSFGVTCYEMLTGHKPFEGVTAEDAKRNQMDMKTRPRSFQLHNAKMSPQLESIILKCLAKPQEQRYPSIGLVIRDLETIV